MAWFHIDLLFRAELKISHIAMSVLIALAKAADPNTHDAFPSIAFIAEKMKLSTRSVKRAVQELAAANLISVKPGRGNRHVNNYRILVHNLESKVTDSYIKGDTQSPLEEAKCHTVTLKVTHSHIKGDSQSPVNIKERKSKSVSKYGPTDDLFAQNVDKSPLEGTKVGENHSAEGRLPPQRDEARQFGYDVAGERPRDMDDVKVCWELVYSMGATKEEADAFCLYNNTRKWSAISATCSVKTLAVSWIKHFKRTDPEGWFEEQRRRRNLRRT